MPKFNLADRVHIDNCTSITATITRISIWGDPANPQTQYQAEYFHEGNLREYWFDEWRLKPATAPAPTCEHCGCKLATTLGGLEYHAGDCPNLPF